MKYIFKCISFLALLAVFACHPAEKEQSGKGQKEDRSSRVHIHRYDLDLFAVNKKDLANEVSRLQQEYAFFLGSERPDEAALLQLGDYLSDTLILALQAAVAGRYPDMDTVREELGEAFRLFQHSFPRARVPVVYTYISGLDHESPVRLVDSVMLIALDMYLGKDSPFYGQLGLPAYRALGCEPYMLVPDCMKELAYREMGQASPPRTLLDWMVFQGKVLYFLDKVLPGKPDYQKINYLPDQMRWVEQNEARLWAFFISNKLLFTTDTREIMKFIPDAPYTKGMPKESPGRAGWWIGWQIVRKFMEKNPGLTLPELLHHGNAQQLLNRSGYKPAK